MSGATPLSCARDAGEMYLVCGVGDHCANGQRITISVVDELADETPRVIDVPYWTDDYGYCKPLPGHDAGVHRPNGLVPIGAQVGQILNFKYSIHHDVWRLPTREAFDACDFSEATMLADTDAGGGCALDEDLECIPPPALASSFSRRPLYRVLDSRPPPQRPAPRRQRRVEEAAAWKAAENAAMFTTLCRAARRLPYRASSACIGTAARAAGRSTDARADRAARSARRPRGRPTTRATPRRGWCFGWRAMEWTDLSVK